MITARCHPALRPLLPEPVPAARALPGWLRKMPARAPSPTAGAEVRTLKQCPPFVDAMALGVLILLPVDLLVEDGEIAWDWDLPILEDADMSRAPIGIHVPEQAAGAPFDTGGRLVVKFVNHWTLEAPAGASLLFTHPLNRDDLPFRTLSGVVDCDLFRDGYVHFPALLDPEFEGTIPRGTPVAQVIELGGRGGTLEVATMDAARISANRAVQARLGAEPGAYRTTWRR